MDETPVEPLELTVEEAAALADIVGAPLTPKPPSERRVRAPRVPREKRPGNKPGPAHAKGRALFRAGLQKEAVELRIAGLKYADIAERLGVSVHVARKAVDEWILLQKPSDEQTEELRQVMQQRLEELHAKFWPIATGTGLTRRGNEREEPNERAGEFLLKVMDRHAKLMGVDLQPNTTTLLISAESVAKFLGWDPDVDVIDVTARELGPGEEAA